MIAGAPYTEEYDREFIDSLADGLHGFSKKYVVITGVSFDDKKIGCCVSGEGRREYYFTERYPGTYYGTGDIFASVLVSSITLGSSCFESARTALDFTARAIKKTCDEGTDTRFGVAFEKFLPLLAVTGEETE
jgi:pyridoxine kinase